MSKELLLKRIKEKARADAKNRRDPRFMAVMGFLVGKGFLKTNLDIPLVPNKHVRVDDAIWAGQNVEPRILEVLPAAVLRLEKHFDLDPVKHHDLAQVVRQLRNRVDRGAPYLGIAYAKLRVWADLPLRDGRVKLAIAKKVTKTFRLKPDAVDKLKALAREWDCTETEALERRVLR